MNCYIIILFLTNYDILEIKLQSFSMFHGQPTFFPFLNNLQPGYWCQYSISLGSTNPSLDSIIYPTNCRLISRTKRLT